jgi:hypothetical protein
MQIASPQRKTQGRLSREDQRRLGDILQRVYDEVIHQGVPERFRHLLDELKESESSGQPAAKSTSVHEGSANEDRPEHQESERLHQRSSEEGESDRDGGMMEAKGHTGHGGKGSEQ